MRNYYNKNKHLIENEKEEEKEREKDPDWEEK